MAQPTSKRLLTEAKAGEHAADPTTPLGAALTSTYVLKADLPPNTLDGGNASSTYGTSFNLDGGSAA